MPELSAAKQVEVEGQETDVMGLDADADDVEEMLPPRLPPPPPPPPLALTTPVGELVSLAAPMLLLAVTATATLEPKSEFWTV